MIGGRIEFSESEDFKIARELHTIDKLPIGSLSVRFPSPIEIKNIRYVCPPACRTPIAEFCFYNENGIKMEIKKAYGKSIHKDQVEFAFDNNQLTSAATKEEEYWIGATLKSDQQLISKIELVPKNDGNFITVNHNYELFYFDNKWISIGKRIATSRKLYYEDVPKGAVLLLRNLTEGNEERIFTMKDSVQVWW